MITDETHKVCNKCARTKELKDFYPHKQCRLGVTGTCRECSKERLQGWYQKTKQVRRAAANRRNKEKKYMAVEYMGGSCQDCGGTFPYCVYDFHHTGSDKEVNPSYALAGSWESALSELNKCVLLCANCHRMRHFSKEVS